MHTKREKVHLLIISEKGRVKSRKISLRLVKYVFIVFLILLLLTSFFTYLYWRQTGISVFIHETPATLMKKIERLQAKIKSQSLEINRLNGLVARLTRENKDLKKHLMNQQLSLKGQTPVPLPPPEKNLKAYKKFLARIARMKSPPHTTLEIRTPKIIVSLHKTEFSFKLYNKSLKKVYGRYVILGIYKPEPPKKVGIIAAYPPKSVLNFTLRPRYGVPFKIERRYITITVTLAHRIEIYRFSEFHVFIFNTRRELVFHEKFKAP